MKNSSSGKFWDIEPQPELLNSLSDEFNRSLAFEASLNAHGMYETLKFVLRLSPRNHELVDSITSRTTPVGSISGEALQAYSTYVHETIHWWQHVGSTSGLLLSLSYLGQTHANLDDLRSVIEKFGLKKPLKRWADEVLLAEGSSAQSKLARANIAINNALDIEYYRAYVLNPKKNIQGLVDQVHFESVGHSYEIAYGQLIGMLVGTFDPEFEFLPKAKHWEEYFSRLNRERFEGHYWGSPVRVPPIGLHAIYEGQARFVQLQFLNRVRKNSPSVADWRDMGYLSGIYVEAFESFLSLSESEWPLDMHDPLVGIFLLVCDISINPTRGFPLDVESFEDFITDVDVGVRFARLSVAVSTLPHLKTAIVQYSKAEYIEVAEELTAHVGYDHPLMGLEEVVAWVGKSSGLKSLMSEYESFNYSLVNHPIRVFFSHFVAFSQDKLRRPEFFCWPGAWMAGVEIGEETADLWLRHLSLFTDKPDKPGVYPRIRPGRDDAAVKSTFENFYGSMSLYDLTWQWILKEGAFQCDYRWMFEEYDQEKADDWANDCFKRVYGVELKDFEVLPR